MQGPYCHQEEKTSRSDACKGLVRELVACTH